MAISWIATAYGASTDATPGDCRTDNSAGGSDGSGAIDTSTATLLVAALGCYNNRASGNTLVDNKSNTWTPLTVRGGSGATLSTIQLFYVNSATPNVGSGHTFTGPNEGGLVYTTIWVWAFAGTGAAPLRTEDGNAGGTNPTSWQAPNSIGVSGDVVVVALTNNLGPGTIQAIDSSFHKSQNFGFVGSNHAAGSGAYLIVGGAVQPIWSGLDGSDAAIALAAFQPAGGGGGFFGSPLMAIQAGRGNV